MASVERQWNHGRMDGYFSAQIRRRKRRIKEEEAKIEVRLFLLGEPSEAFFPAPNQESVEREVATLHEEPDIFDRYGNTAQPRSADLAKRRGVVINTLLEKPQNFPATRENLSFIERQFDRIQRFAVTLRNKRRLHPQIQKIFDL